MLLLPVLRKSGPLLFSSLMMSKACFTVKAISSNKLMYSGEGFEPIMLQYLISSCSLPSAFKAVLPD